jgi:hypothetical protein
MNLRAEGNYDSMEFTRERFLPQVEEAVKKLVHQSSLGEKLQTLNPPSTLDNQNNLYTQIS